MITRKDYMDGKCTHDDYYEQFVDTDVIRIVEKEIGIDTISKSEDKHFNDIPLKHWDVIGLPAKTMRAVNDSGDTFTLSTKVCIAKRAGSIIKMRNNK